MPDSRRFEDQMTIKEIMGEYNQKELMARIYIQTLKTNGQVRDSCKDIDELKIEMKTKMDWNNIKRAGILLTVIISILTIPNIVIGIIRLIGG